jgi:hypothetical protein
LIAAPHRLSLKNAEEGKPGMSPECQTSVAILDNGILYPTPPGPSVTATNNLKGFAPESEKNNGAKTMEALKQSDSARNLSR